MTPTFFETSAAFRAWLAQYHLSKTVLLVGFYKLGSGKTSMTWSESVDQALCFGWIDGVRKAIDTESYCIRFTPRKPTSIWSTVNIQKMETLQEAGLMTEAGLQAFAQRIALRSSVYSHENAAMELSPDFERQFKTNALAWDFFSRQAPSYKKQMVHWIMTAKQTATQLSRLEKTIAISEQQERMR